VTRVCLRGSRFGDTVDRPRILSRSLKNVQSPIRPQKGEESERGVRHRQWVTSAERSKTTGTCYTVRTSCDASVCRSCLGPQRDGDLGLRASFQRTEGENASTRSGSGVSGRSALANSPPDSRSRGPPQIGGIAMHAEACRSSARW
jgi:hypothetical protein